MESRLYLSRRSAQQTGALKMLLLVALVMIPSVARSQTSWTGSTSSDWFDPSNWSAGVPTASVPTVINGGPAATIMTSAADTLSLTLGSNLPSNLLILGGGDLRTTEDSFIGEVAGTSRLSIGGGDSIWNGDGKLTVGKSGNGELILTAGGKLRSGSLSMPNGAVIAEGQSSVSKVTVSGLNSYWDIFGNMSIGVAGWASMEISDGGDVWNRDQVSSTAIGAGSNAEIKVSGTGSRWKTESVDLAVRGTSLLEVSAGGKVESFRMNVGVEGPSFGRVIVRDSGSELLVNDLTVATFGRGELQVLNNATVGVLGETLYSLAPLSGGLASVLISERSAMTGRSLVVGDDGAASLRVNQSGNVFMLGGGIRVGPTALVQVSDNGSVMASSNDLFVEGQLTVDAQAELRSATGIVQNVASQAGVTVTGANWTTTGSLRIGEAGSAQVIVREESLVRAGSTKLGGSSSGIVNLLLDNSSWYGLGGGTEITGRSTDLLVINGGTFTAGAIFDLNPVTMGIANVQLVGSRLLTNDLLVRGDGTSNFSVLNGSSVSAVTATIQGERTAHIQISGSETGFFVLGDLTVKGPGMNNLSVGSGASLRSSSGIVGNTGTGISTVNVVGEGTTWQVGNITVGNVGQGIITVTGGGDIESNRVIIGEASGSRGTMDVVGEGSRWSVGGALTIGQQGTGILAIRNGGIVTNSTAAASTSLGSEANITIDGEGSQWISSGRVQLGFGGSVNLDVANGGLVKAPEFIMVDVTGELTAGTIESPLIALFGGSLLNDGTIIGDIALGADGRLTGSGVFNGQVSVLNGGIFSPGNSPGTVTTPTTTWGAGGSYQWEINALEGIGGQEGGSLGWDLWNTGDLAITGPFTVALTTLTSDDEAGPLSGWNPTQSHLWRIATATNAAFGAIENLQIDSSQFANPLAGGTFSFRTSADGNELYVRFSAVPEASSMILVGVFSVVGIGLTGCRRLRNTPAK